MTRLTLLALAIAAASSAASASTPAAESAAGSAVFTSAAAARPLISRCNASAHQPSKTDADCARNWFDSHLRLNDLLVVGSHNSYKARIPDNELAVIAKVSARVARNLDYAHPSLTTELNAGARQLELDVYYDPEGGRYLSPMVVRRAKADLGEAWKAAMARPGFKTFHIADVDVRSSCITFRACLAEVRAWSDAHPRHVPIIITINAKDGFSVPGGVEPLPFDTAAFDALDGEVRAELADRLITPDTVQGSYPTLREAVLKDNWPTLGEARGRILFALDEPPHKVAIYRGNRRSLEGRVMFINTPDENSPAAAYFTFNDPQMEAGKIRRAVAQGFIVRTRADADTREARANDTAPRDTALAGGAQFISTDYLWPDPRLPGGYRVNLPGASAVCNPVRTGKRCAGMPIETQAPLGIRPPDESASLASAR
ncbi:MAG: phosphatidylinositol-specific phospholipase C1-like protein [Sphingomonadales bacterium]|nr:phosphatidylinositol-specific phospholipase C1-like protein [Sphingomonadales bacterium]